MSLTSQSSFASEPNLRMPASGRSTAGRAIDARYFEPGACVEYPPATGDHHQTVFLDAGHGGLDPGGVGETRSGQTIDEADETLPVELDTMHLLRAEGFTVVVSRTEAEPALRPQPGDISGGLFTVQGVRDDVAARDICANMAKANVLVGIYFDAGGSPYNASPNLGVVDVSELGGPALSTAAAGYGHLLLLGPADPEWFTTPSQMPGALIEPVFITDPFEGTQVDNPSGQQVIAGEAIQQYFAPSAGARSQRPRHNVSLRRIPTVGRELGRTRRMSGNGGSKCCV
jgi:N-acetylmuramoyl-L-alanine amidase